MRIGLIIQMCNRFMYISIDVCTSERCIISLHYALKSHKKEKGAERWPKILHLQRFFSTDQLWHRTKDYIKIDLLVLGGDPKISRCDLCKLTVTSRSKSRIFHNSFLLIVETKVRFVESAQQLIVFWEIIDELERHRSAGIHSGRAVVYLFFIWRSSHVFT